MKIRTLIVDDEPLARERIRLLLREEVDLVIAGECSGGPEAVAAVRREAPDLMFLDVQMPEMDGFAVLRAIGPEKLPAVIFTTAYDQHALKAFDAHALDYLLKPFKPARFKEAVERARRHLAQRKAGTQMESLLALISQRPAANPHLTRLAVKTADRVIFLKTGDIDSIESAGNYVAVHVGKDSHILRETLNALEAQLDPEKFLRVSRSAIVNLDRVKEVQPMFKGEHLVVLHGGRQIAMTRGLREVEKALKFS